MRDVDFMRAALALAAEDPNEVPVGAVLVRDELIIGSAHNEQASSCDPLAHAEMLAIRRAAERLKEHSLKGCTLYVTLEPCPMCAGAIIMTGIDRVVFGAFDSAYGCCGSLYALPMDSRFNNRAEVIGGVLDEEAGRLLHDFFAARRP